MWELCVAVAVAEKIEKMLHCCYAVKCNGNGNANRIMRVILTRICSSCNFSFNTFFSISTAWLFLFLLFFYINFVLFASDCFFFIFCHIAETWDHFGWFGKSIKRIVYKTSHIELLADKLLDTDRQSLKEETNIFEHTKLCIVDQ